MSTKASTPAASTPGQRKRFSVRLILPIFVLLALSVFLLRGLWLDPKKLPSTLIGKPLPVADLQLLRPQKGAGGQLEWVPDPQPVSISSLQGQPWVLNVFASWCQACLVEHPHWLAMQKVLSNNAQASSQTPALVSQKPWRLVGLAYKDELQATLRWLQENGNPYDFILLDPKGQYGIDLGVYGVPETFVVSADNHVLHKQVGPVPATFVSQVQQILAMPIGGKS